MAVRWKWNVAGFAQLRNHPTLVRAMERAAESAADGTPFEVEVVTWPHAGVRTGPRTSVQIWARSPQARRRVNRYPGELVNALNKARL